MLATVKKAPRRRGATPSSNDNPFPCVIGERFPKYCNKRFPTVEKHNEHLKRFHSPIFWCKQCLHKFNSSWTEKVLSLDRADHDRYCLGTPSQKNQERRDRCYVMSEEEYNRFESRKWKKTIVPVQPEDNGEKETLPHKSWRQIRETIFPTIAETGDESTATHAAPSKADQSPQDIVAIVETRSSEVMTRLITQFGSPARYASPQVPELDRISGTNTTTEDFSQLSTLFSESTNPPTRPSTLNYTYSYSGTDGLGDTDSYGIGGVAEPEPLPNRAHDLPEDDQLFPSVFGAGQWGNSTTLGPIDESYIDFDPVYEQEIPEGM
ncbi:hypothetical protein NW762_013003 [Fusarium torreyae]|uniref:Uncharacterized protein n=1 Tax=Fusarium torreyae TaxID=1237075 RepID=A0A9W8RQM1_9HYPO|nr:hypothetical protein NW762_013003 [Fusarium torreyae]